MSDGEIVGIIPTIVVAGVATHMVTKMDKTGKKKKHAKKTSGKKHRQSHVHDSTNRKHHKKYSQKSKLHKLS